MQLDDRTYIVRKVSDIPVPSQDVTYEFMEISLGGGNNLIIIIIQPRGSLVRDIPAGDGNVAKPFLRCTYLINNIFLYFPQRIIETMIQKFGGLEHIGLGIAV